MQSNLEVVARNPRHIDHEHEFIDLIAGEICAGIQGAVGIWMEKLEEILHSDENDSQKLRRLAALLYKYRSCRRQHLAMTAEL
jgi:hypothetical protein